MGTTSRATRWLHAWSRRGVLFDPARQNNFDLLRLIAATLVLVDHSFPLTGRPAIVGPFRYESLGGFAVAVFFVISGFLVAGSWQRAPRLGTFALKRALRIFPAYAVVAAAGALVLGPIVTDLAPGRYFHDAQTWAYFRSLTFVELHYTLPGVFLHNPYPAAVNGSIWTLPIEVVMYVALAVLGCVGLMRRAVVTALVAVLAIVWFGWEAELRAAPPLFISVLLTSYTVHLGLWFFLGSACWVWRDRIRYRADLAALLVALLWGTVGTPLGLVLVHLAVPYLVLWAAQLPVGWMNRFGRHGDFSYGMYLYAFPVQQTLVWCGAGHWPFVAYVAACFGVTLLCAIASWHWVEHPALTLKRRAAGPRGRGRPDAGLIPRKAAGPPGP